MSHYVNVSWVGAGKVRDRVTYDSHREETLAGGQTRELRGIGDRYRALRGDEAAVLKQLETDGARFRTPLYPRGKLTVNDSMAKRIAGLNPVAQERAMRDAVEKTFESAWRSAQGVYVLHFHGGRDRPNGHPHVHFVLSAQDVGGKHAYLARERLARFKVAWARELDRAVERQLARLGRPDLARREPPGHPEPRRDVGRSIARQHGLLPILRGYYMARGALRHPLRFGVNFAVRTGVGALVRANVGVMKGIAERFPGGRQRTAGVRPGGAWLRGVASAIIARSFRRHADTVPILLRAPVRAAYSLIRTFR